MVGGESHCHLARESFEGGALMVAWAPSFERAGYKLRRLYRATSSRWLPYHGGDASVGACTFGVVAAALGLARMSHCAYAMYDFPMYHDMSRYC